MSARKKLALAAGIGLVAASVATGGATAAADDGWSVQQVVSGLSSPRGVVFDGVGAMYVAEAGAAGAGGFGVTATGAVDKYTWSNGAASQQWSTPFTSVYLSEEGGTDVLGPAGLSATGRGCFHQGNGRRLGCQVLMIMSLSHDGGLHETGQSIPQIGHLYRLNSATGAASDRSDVGDQQYAWTTDHQSLFPSDFPDSNPYGVLVTKGAGGGIRTFVADAGANTISEVLRDGTTRVISYLPNEGPPAFRDATPTCIAQGPDGMLYVGALDLVANFITGGGQSNVWRVDPNSTDWEHNATLWATGFTTITSCTFDRSGNFWATEMFYDNPGGPPGDLAMAPFSDPTAIEHIGGGSLLLPGGVAQGPDGAMYVTTGSAAPAGAGGVARVASP